VSLCGAFEWDRRDPMPVFGIDYAAGDPQPSRLKAAGVHFVCRYVSTPGNPKNLRPAEAKRLRDAGIDVVVVFETTATRALAGTAAGVSDAKKALAQARDCMPHESSPIYFAVDFDATPGNQAAINAYLSGAASFLGKDHVGIYGGYYPVQRALNAGVCKYAWQTYAWSGGQWDPRAHIRQYKNGEVLAGINVDFDRAMFADFGQWRKSAPRRHDGPVDFIVSNQVVASGNFQKSRRVTQADVGKLIRVPTPELAAWVKALRANGGVGRVRPR
jgi:Domain of unknown function (DUF1906)